MLCWQSCSSGKLHWISPRIGHLSRASSPSSWCDRRWSRIRIKTEGNEKNCAKKNPGGNPSPGFKGPKTNQLISNQLEWIEMERMNGQSCAGRTADHLITKVVKEHHWFNLDYPSIFSYQPAFLQLGLSTAHVCADWVLDWSLAATDHFSSCCLIQNTKDLSTMRVVLDSQMSLKWVLV